MDPNDNRGDEDDGPPLLVDISEPQEEAQPKDPKEINLPRVPITIVTGNFSPSQSTAGSGNQFTHNVCQDIWVLGKRRY